MDAGHHVFDDAVLARCIHALQHDQHRPLALGVQHLLPLGKPREALGEHRLHAVLVDGKAEILGRIVIGEPEAFRLVDPAPLNDFWQLHLRLRIGPPVRTALPPWLGLAGEPRLSVTPRT
jgi:hypothetical protein